MMHNILILFTWVSSHKILYPINHGWMIASLCLVASWHSLCVFAITNRPKTVLRNTNFRNFHEFLDKGLLWIFSSQQPCSCFNVWWQRWQCSHLSNNDGELVVAMHILPHGRPDTLRTAFAMTRLSLCTRGTNGCDFWRRFSRNFQNIFGGHNVECDCDCSWAVWQGPMSYAFISMMGSCWWLWYGVAVGDVGWRCWVVMWLFLLSSELDLIE